MSIPLVTIDANGITAPSFQDILAYYQDAYRGIYGSDVVLTPDTQDGQWVAIQAAAVNDVNASIVAAYQAFSPSTAQGAGLSRVVKINGMARAVPTNSTTDVKIGGQAGTVITGGVVSDAGLGTRWNLPATVTIPYPGEITVTATAADLGAIRASAGAITKIETPTLGWQTVTNLNAATVGMPVETDAQLRRRQTLSTALPSVSILDGVLGSVMAVSGVTRAKLYENDGSTLDANGIPGHALALVVEGGDAPTIAQVLAVKKGPGVGTYGSTMETVTDTAGVQRNIAFFRPRLVQIQYVLELRALPGFSVNAITAIKTALSDWTNGLDIAQDVMRTRAFVPANLPGDATSSTFEILTLRVARDGRIPTEQDIVIGFNERAACSTGAVVVRVPAGV